jgi:hypothetical protein
VAKQITIAASKLRLASVMRAGRFGAVVAQPAPHNTPRFFSNI